MTRCLLALGSNLGNRRENLDRAAGEVASLPGCRLLARSQWLATTPIGGPIGQGEFLNGSVLLETQLNPAELSSGLHHVERRLGRERIVRWDARVIDIDLLLYAAERVDTPELTVPHPRMSFRRFVLEPACEIAGWMVDPRSGWTLAQLLRHLETAPRQVAVMAGSSESAQCLAREIAGAFGSAGKDLLVSPVASGADSTCAERLELVQPPALTIEWREVASGANQPARGPRALVTGCDFPAVLSEAVAAVRAAWPELARGTNQ